MAGKVGSAAGIRTTEPNNLPSGYAKRGPYQAIHVGAAAPNIPDALIEQLARPGRMFIPVEDPSGDGQ